MSLTELVEVWWDTLRIPLVLLALAAWVYFDRLRRSAVVESLHEPTTGDVKTSVPEVATEALRQKAAVAAEIRETVVQEKRKKSPKRFTRPASEQVIKRPAEEILPAPTD